MKTFQFSLERVLQWRRTQLELERVAMQRLAQLRTELEAAMRGIECSRTLEELSLIGAATVESAALQTVAAWQARVAREKEALRARHAQTDKDASAQMTKVTEAQRRVRLLERLRDAKQREWTHAMEAEQERFAAEAWLGRWTSIT